MKKRIVSAILAVLTLCSIMASTALAVEESAQSLRAGVLVCPSCDRGTFYTVYVENGLPWLKEEYAMCPVNKMYNCAVYGQRYIVSEKCSHCGYQYNIHEETGEVWKHRH